MVFTDKGLKAIRDEVNSLHEQRVDRLTNINVGCIPPETFADVVKRTPPGGTIYWPSVGCVAPGTIVDCEDKPQGRFEALLDKYDDLLSRFGE